MTLPDDPGTRMLVLVWGVLLAAAIPLAALTPVRRRAGGDVRSMWVKYASWFIMVPAITVPLLLGRAWTQAALMLLSFHAFEEFSRAVGLWRERGHVWLARACIALVYLPVFIPWYGLFMTMPVCLVILIYLYPVMRDRYRGMIQCSCLTIVGVIYFGWFPAHLAFLMNAAAGPALLLAFLLVVVMNDASAYLIGSSVGRRLLSPNLSPRKTVEGTLGAMAVSIALIFLVRFALGGISSLHALLLGLLLSVGGTCGDLTMSLIKRDVGVKDSGALIPGHGGLLDRLDSIVFTAPLFFHFMSHFYPGVMAAP
ncbi:MAG: CDP-archaeol synthase [bacterium]|nr:CDP-archaeol synthase [bacterium]